MVAPVGNQILCLKLYCHWEWGHTHTCVSDIHVILWTMYTSLLNKKEALYQEPLSNYQAPATAWNDWEMGITTYFTKKTDMHSSISKAACLNSYFSSTKIIAYKEKWAFVWPCRNCNRILTSSVGHVRAHHYMVNNCLGRCSQHGITLPHITTTTTNYPPSQAFPLPSVSCSTVLFVL